MKHLSGKNRIFAAIMTAAVLLTLLGACAKHAPMTDENYDRAPMETGLAGMYAYAQDSSVNGTGSSYDYKSDGTYEDTYSQNPQDSSPNLTADTARKLIKSVSMNLETKEFDAFLSDLYARIESVGGYIQSSNVNGGKYSRYDYYERNAHVTARIPADRLDSFCDGVAGTANVVSRREETDDVTLQYYDTESHMKALRSEYDTLVGILEKCTKLEDVISVQGRITEVLYQIESYKTTLNNYDNLVSYSTVTMSIAEVQVETIVTEQTVGERIVTGLSESLRNIREDSEDLLVSFLANLPYLLIWGVIILGVVLAVRAGLRHTRKKRNGKKEAEARAPSDKE